CEPLLEEPPLGSAAAPERASTGTSCALPSATDVARHRAQSSKSIPGPPAASPSVRHRRNPSCVPAARDWIAPAPNATFQTSALRLLASRIAPSNTFPMPPKLVSNIAPSIPYLLRCPLARRAIPPATAVVRDCCQTIIAQSGTHHRLPRRTPRQPVSFYGHRF